MRSLLLFVRRSFAWMLCAFPRRFQADFGEEMERVFNELTTEASRQGILSLLVIWFR